MSSIERDAYRAAGQAVLAIVQGLPIADVTLGGIEIAWPEMPASTSRPRPDVLDDMIVGLGGLIAEDRYCFGDPPDLETPVWTRIDQKQRGDWDIVRELADQLDVHSDALFESWRYARRLVFAPEIWRAIERVAAALRGGPLRGDEIARIVAEERLQPGGC